MSEYHVIYRPRGDEDWISCPGLEVQGIDESKEEIDAEDEQRNDTSFVGGRHRIYIGTPKILYVEWRYAKWYFLSASLTITAKWNIEIELWKVFGVAFLPYIF